MNYSQLLTQNDHPTNWEYPPGFDYKTANARFSQFVATLSAVLGVSVPSETGSAIQDASFHSQAFLPLPGGQQAVIRFSNFGDLVTVTDIEAVPESMLTAVLELLARHGYTYIPVSVLHAPYTGTSPHTGILTWWTRYFDWL